MNIKEQAVKNLLVSLIGSGSKSLNLKGTISFDLDVSFKEDANGDVTVDVNRDYDSDVNVKKTLAPSTAQAMGPVGTLSKSDRA